MKISTNKSGIWFSSPLWHPVSKYKHGEQEDPLVGNGKFQIKGFESGGEIDVGDMRLAPNQVVFQELHNDNDNNDNDNILSLWIVLLNR